MILKKFEDFYQYYNFPYSQNKQDLFALFIKGNSPGFFVEFGASDGLDCSNTYMLEKLYNWNGILAEPAIGWVQSLKNNRRCFIEEKCVADTSNKKMLFWELNGGKGLSGLAEYAEQDGHSSARRNDNVAYEVDTISLDDLLNKYNAPETVDYMSVDTEGSEFIILNSYSFSRKFNFITIEHNYTSNKENIDKLLESKGYVKILEDFSKWDSWFVCSDIYERINGDS
jgi:FkbM family methyltransferase